MLFARIDGRTVRHFEQSIKKAARGIEVDSRLGCRYCDGLISRAGRSQPVIRLAMDSQKGGQSNGKSKVPYEVG